MRVRKLSLGVSFNGHNANSARMASKVVNSYRLLLGLLSSILLLSGCAYIGPASPLGFKSALAQVNSLQSLNPFSPDFLSLAIGLTPQLHGVNLNLSRVQDTVSCDLTLPITYVNSGCMSELQLLLPITVSNSSHQNQTVLYEGNATLTPISLSIGVTSDNITAGETQTVTVTTTNASSGANIVGAEVNLNVTDQSGTTIDHENATSDSVGQTSFTFTVPSDASVGTFQVDVRASAPGYEPTFETSTFGVIGLGSSFDNSTNFDNSSSDSGSSSSDSGSSSSDGSSSSSSNNDFTSPTVKSTSPKDNDNNVDPSTNTVTVTFSEKIDKNTVDTGSLTLDPNVGSGPSIQKASVSGKTATFTINGLLPHVDYLATISSSIEDSNGNFLDCPGSSGVDSLCQWSFSTSGSSPSAAITIDPTSGAVGSILTVQGTGFIPNSQVTIKFDDASGTDTTDNNGDFTFSFSVPPSISGDHTVSATQLSTTVSKTFKVIPSIALDPTSGPVGTSMTVTGAGFSASSTVNIKFDGNNVNTNPATVSPDTKGGFTATFTVPNSSSLGSKTVLASQGTNSASKAFTVTNPNIILNPTSGPNGTAVNITGNGFDPSTTVNLKFDTNALTPATTPTNNNGAFLASFNVPPSSTGNHTVTASEGANIVSKPFTVTDEFSATVASKSAMNNRTTSLPSTENSSNHSTSTLVLFNSSNASNSSNSSDELKLSNADVSNSTSVQKTREQTPDTKPVLSSNNSSSLIELPSAKVIDTKGDSTSNDTTAAPSKGNSLSLSSLSQSGSGYKNKSVTEGTPKLSLPRVVNAPFLEKVLNVPPIAVDDAVLIKNKAPINIAALKNDRDPDSSGDLRIVGLSPPAHGTVISNSNGTITYTPQPLWKGTDVFQYSVTDGHGGIASATVTVETNNVKNHTPKAQTQSVSLKENNHAKILLKGKDSDKDPLSFDIVEKPSHGTIAEFSSLSGSLVYTPDGNYVGHDTFTFKVSDGNADSKTAKVSLRVIADKNTHQTKTSTLKPNLLHELQPQPQTPQQNNNPSSDQQQQQPDPQELKKIENQAEKQVLNQQPTSQQEQPSGGSTNGQSKQQNEQSSQQDASSSQPQ